MSASISEIGAKLSSTDVRMCTARNAIASSETLRCSASTMNRGQRGELQRRTSTTPSTIASGEQDQRDRAGRAGQVPVGARPGAREHGSCREKPPTGGGPLGRRAGVGRARGPAAEREHVAALVDEPRGQRLRGEPRGACSPRTSAAVVAMFASAQSPAATLTVRQGPRAGAPVAGSMMWCIVCSAVAPAPHRRARGGEAARADRDRLPGRRGVAAVVVGDADRASRPAARRPPWRCRRRGSTSAPQPQPPRRPRRRGRPPTLSRSRRGRAGSARARAPRRSRGRSRSPASRSAPAAVTRRRAARTAGRAARAGASRGRSPPARAPADRRVDVAVGQRRGAQRELERLEQQRAHAAPAPAGAVHARELGVRRGSGCRRGRSRRARARPPRARPRGRPGR